MGLFKKKKQVKQKKKLFKKGFLKKGLNALVDVGKIGVNSALSPVRVLGVKKARITKFSNPKIAKAAEKIDKIKDAVTKLVGTAAVTAATAGAAAPALLGSVKDIKNVKDAFSRFDSLKDNVDLKKIVKTVKSKKLTIPTLEKVTKLLDDKPKELKKLLEKKVTKHSKAAKLLNLKRKADKLLRDPVPPKSSGYAKPESRLTPDQIKKAESLVESILKMPFRIVGLID